MGYGSFNEIFNKEVELLNNILAPGILLEHRNSKVIWKVIEIIEDSFYEDYSKKIILKSKNSGNIKIRYIFSIVRDFKVLNLPLAAKVLFSEI